MGLEPVEKQAMMLNLQLLCLRRGGAKIKGALLE
jgi:hypothetical protein